MGNVSRIAILAIVIGAVARFAFLDSPLFFRDEAITALFTTGHHYEAYSRLFDGKEHSVAEIRATMSVAPSLGPIDAVKALAKEDPHHAPLFYFLERVWIGIFGSSVTAFRSFPALLGVIGIGLAFALLRNVADSRTAWIGASLFALSPMFVSLSRDAREYALLVDVVLLATIALVLALRKPTVATWIAYAAMVAIGLYTDSLFAGAMLAHGAIVIALERRDLRKLFAWSVACAAGCIALLPWALNAFRLGSRISSELDWVRTSYSLKYGALKWIFNLGSLGFDGEFRSLKLGVLGALAALIVVAATVVLALRESGRARVVSISLSAVTIASFLALDAVQHAHFSTVARYMCVAWIGLELGVAIVIGAALASPRRSRLAGTVWVSMLVFGVASFAIRGNAESWWNNTDDIAYRTVAREIESNALYRPLVIVEDRAQMALELSRYLPTGETLMLLQPDSPPKTTRAQIILVAPTRELREAAARVVGVEPRNISPPSKAIYANAKSDSAESERDSDAVTATNALWYVGRPPKIVL